MRLMTKAIAAKLIDADKRFLASGDGRTSEEIAVKYFTPWANATWYIVSGTPLDANGEADYEAGEAGTAADWHLFGYADLGLGPECAELGYVLLSELEGLKGPFGLNVERDLYYEGHTLPEVMEVA